MENKKKYPGILLYIVFARLICLALSSNIAEGAETPKVDVLNVDPFCKYLGEDRKNSGNGPEGITLCEALKNSLSNGAQIKGQEQIYEASEGRVEQAGLIPNPTLLGDLDKYNEEVTVQLSQTVELGGKRGGRIELARLERLSAKADFESKRIEVLENVKRRFIEVLLIQEKLVFGQKRYELAKEIQATAQRRLNAGRGMPVEMIKAGLAVTASELEVSRLNAQLANARRQLAAMIGVASAAPVLAVGNLANMPVDPARFATFSLDKSPAVQRTVLDLELRKAELDLAKSNAVPDVTLSAGVRRFKEEAATGLIVGIAIPLPVLNRNQGAIREAKGGVSASEFNRDAERLRIDAELLGTIQEIQTAYAESIAFKNQILPAAEKAFASANEFFQRGKLDYLNVLDAQRDLFNSREQYLQSLVAYHEALAEIERLTGKGVSELLNNNGSGEK